MPRSRLPIRLLAPLLAVSLFACAVDSQDAKKPTAIKLPDGTIVFYTANPNEAAPKIDGVILSAKEYAQLVEQADQLKKLREAVKPVAPSVCRIRGRIDATTGKPIARLSLEFSYRTTQPRTPILLGGQRAAPVAATGADGKVPLLEITPDGLAVLVEQPGEGRITLELEAAMSGRGGKNEIGFELGLPRAAITSLVFEPPSPSVKKLTIGTRTPESGAQRPVETKRTTEDASRYAAKPGGTGVPLGPIDFLEVGWETQTTANPSGTDNALAADADITIRVDDAQIETTTRLRLRGPAREWRIALPRDSTVTAGRPMAAESMATVVRPTDGKQPLWLVQTPEPGEWLVTAVVRQPRPDAKDPKYPGPNAVAVAHVAGLPRQAGTIRVFAPATIRVSNYRHPAEFRRLDATAGAEAPVASFRYALAGPNPPFFEFEARAARGFTAVQPHHKLDLTHEGWRLRTELRVSPVRTTVEQLTLELPAGWRDPIVRPDDRVDEVQAGTEANGRRPWTIRLANGMSEPFALTVESLFPVPETSTEIELALPRFPGSTERETAVTVSVPEGLAVRGASRDATAAVAFAPVGGTKAAAAVQIAGTFELPVEKLELAWQPYRAELSALLRADVTLGERQMTVSQTIQFKSADPIGRPIRFKGPTNPLALQGTPALESAGIGQWTWTPAPDVKDATVTTSFSLPLPPRGDGKPIPVDVPLIWPDTTSVAATVRIWGMPSPGARRPVGIQGPWTERPPEPVAERDSLPWLTLAATGSTRAIPLAMELVETIEEGGTTIERAAFQTWVGPDGTTMTRTRFLLKRWSPAGFDLEVPGVPTILVNRERVDGLVPLSTGLDGDRSYRVPLPEAKPNRTSLVVDIQYSLPPRPRGEMVLVPPRIRGSVLLAPVRVQISLPNSATSLVFGSSFVPDSRWGWRGGFPSPMSGLTSDELDRWFLGGTAPAEDETWDVATDDAITGRLYDTANLRVIRLPRLPFVIGCSLLTLLIGFGITRLHPRLIGPAVALVGLLAVAAGAFIPQPASQILAASLPGFGALLLALGVASFLRWQTRRRIDYLPTFRREVVPIPAPTAGSGSNTRPSRNGSPAAESGRTATPMLPPQATG